MFVCLVFHVEFQIIRYCSFFCNVNASTGVVEMDSGFEDLELRESQREYLDFLDDDVKYFILCLSGFFLPVVGLLICANTK